MKIILRSLCTSVLGLVCAFHSLASNPLEPDVSVVGVELSSVSLHGWQFGLTLEVHNPTPFSVTVDALDYSLLLNTSEVAVGKLDQTATFAADSRREIKVPLTVRLEKHLSALLALLDERAKVNYEVNGHAWIRGYKQPIPFRYLGQLPVPNPAQLGAVGG